MQFALLVSVAMALSRKGLISKERAQIKAWLRNKKPSEVYKLIRQNIDDRRYQVWAAMHVWFLYDFKNATNSCKLQQLASLLLDCQDLSFEILEHYFNKIGFPKTTATNEALETDEQRRINPPVDPRTQLFLEKNVLQRVDLKKYSVGINEDYRQRARPA